MTTTAAVYPDVLEELEAPRLAALQEKRDRILATMVIEGYHPADPDPVRDVTCVDVEDLVEVPPAFARMKRRPREYVFRECRGTPAQIRAQVRGRLLTMLRNGPSWRDELLRLVDAPRCDCGSDW